ncbi:hypothetical protein CASFOL_036877 [Castilleja foliolosa]|uniref:C2 NT-type domain-containing protein n=1 Tax=Castilleja foliolosa TaxID=1961234 RepID=A0ABD3BRG4_9LAMI
MFKPARWWSEKNRIKVDFKLQFHASQVTQVGGDGLMVSVVPSESGKPAVKSDKATVQDGCCKWEKPVYETVKFNQDLKTGKIHERIYCFIVGTGSSKSGVVGEASIDLSNYAEATKVSSLSLPLKNSKTEAMLHVSIQRIQGSMDEREIGEHENAKLLSVEDTLSTLLDNHDKNGTNGANFNDDIPFIKAFPPTELNLKHRASSGSDVTLSSSESSSGVEAPWELQINNDNNIHHDPKSGDPTPTYNDHRRSWDWLGNPALEASTTDEESPDIVIEKLKSEVIALSRQAAMSDLELQSLRKQIVKESKRGNELMTENVCLKEECEHLKTLQRQKNLVFDGLDSHAVIEELKQELNHAREMNANLQVQLQKTQESNSELILAVQDLDEMLEQKNGSSGREVGPTCSSDDDEQKALEDLVKDHGDSKEGYLLDQQITDLRNEIEIYKRDKEELETQMEQIALDYEIMKQSNHELSSKLEQSLIQEQLKMQYECLSPDSGVNELENHIENLEDELKRRSGEYINSISTLEAHAKSLEEELEKQAQGFEADLESLTRAKIEQEQRAIRAEELLKKIRWKNANTAERLQEEFKRLSMQMTCSFEANEKLTSKSMAEANELCLQKHRLEEKVRLMTSQIEDMQSETEMHVAKNTILLEDLESKKGLMRDLEQMRILVKEKELLVEQQNDERSELEKEVILAKNEAEELEKELNKMRCALKEKEMVVENMQSELESIRAQCTEMKGSRLEEEKLRKQVLQLRSDLKKRDEAFNGLEKKLKDGNGRGPTAISKNKTSPRAPKEVTSLKERIKLLERQIKSTETSANTFLEKEKDLLNKIQELEGKVEVYENSARFRRNEVVKPAAAGAVDQNSSTTSIIFNNKSDDLSEAQIDSAKNGACVEELNDEMALLREKNKSMEEDLQEMQDRYLDISLKFAEVEGERQQLIMKLRNLSNANRSS